MGRKTFDFGIDLGTTNSSIAIVEGTETLVIKNNAGAETTPSAVFIDNRKTLIAGEAAKEKLEKDPGNAFFEFKRQMGTQYVYHFERSGKEMTPEELSAEVLKSLKQNVQQRMNEEVKYAVITVPAAFELPQNEATSKAAALAGIKQYILLQEPVAAALAYGFQEEKENVFWLVYDLGGGTFDAALIQLKEGAIRAVDHEGDNYLGGKDIDWEILNQLIIPKVQEDYKLSNFTRSNPKWNNAFAMLKAETEKAKIRLSRDKFAEVDIPYFGTDDDGTPMLLNHDLHKEDVEQLVSPYVTRTINICKDLLGRNNLRPSDVEKIVLVGGPTLMPHLRNMLSDSDIGLGIDADFSVDPLTAVARGAAIFAGTSRIEIDPVEEDVELKPGLFSLNLEYKPVGSEDEPLIGGTISNPETTSCEKYTIQFINETSQPSWDSGQVAINKEGTFITNLWAQKGLKNIYKIILFNAAGEVVPAVPTEIEYTIGLAFSNPPLTHSLGIAMADNRVDVVFEKGASLPVKRRVKHSTIKYLASGSEDQIIIPIVEGKNLRADRNPDVGSIVVNGKEINRDLPAGSEVEVLIEIDQSRLMKASAYVPILDQEFDGVAKLRSPEPDPETVRKDFQRERERLEKLVGQLDETGNKRATIELKRLEEEQIVQEVEVALKAVNGDRDAVQMCNDRIRKMQATLDKIEDAVEWPTLLEQANGLMESVKILVNNQGSQNERQAFRNLLVEVKKAIDSRDPISLVNSIERLRDFGSMLYWKQPGAWVEFFERTEGRRAEIRDQSLAGRLLNQGRKAIDNNNIDELQSICLQLSELFPGEEDLPMAGYGGGTIKV